MIAKLYPKIVIERVENETENKIWDVLARFRKRMGWVGWDGALKNNTFVDLEKGYYRVKRNDLWRNLSMHGVSSGLIRALQSLCRDYSACVRINGANTDWFNISQGCVASS
ncbi:hypothetical protein EVAR_6906_1 [Eumeta japonica]|uniref:Uncharacterized protein n=1 Tax=Eumeta variegata TaxID=151549 RepID=A0A4C1TIZ0_EUMVA|nr:hypothetical protein EVAR_6906_1 [Eumeta japonica]